MRPVGTYLAPKRFLAFIALLVIATWLAAEHFAIGKAGMIGFDAAALFFLLSVTPLFRRHSPDEMRDIARQNDANRMMMLAISGVVILAILVAVGAEINSKQSLGSYGIALVIGTLAIAWLFSNMVYTLHYAHIYYLVDKVTGRDRGGIDFPGKHAPDYVDFLYFAFTLGMTFQTSDTEITSRHVRLVAVFHSFAAFVFNIGVLAFTINVLGGG